MGSTRHLQFKKKIRNFIVNNFKTMTWIFWFLQVGFMVIGISFLITSHYFLGITSIVLSITYHALTAKFRRYVIENLQASVSTDPLFGLPGRIKRTIRRKIERNGSVH